jgi:hypothetical protein
MGILLQHAWEPLHKDTLETFGLVAEELASVNHKLHSPLTPREITRASSVPTVDSRTYYTAFRTGDSWSERFGMDDDSIPNELNEVDVPKLRIRFHGMHQNDRPPKLCLFGG